MNKSNQALAEYERDYRGEALEITALVQAPAYGCVISNGLRIISVRFVSAINTKTGESLPDNGTVCRAKRDKKHMLRPFGFPFKGLRTYRMVVRRPTDEANAAPNQYMLVKVKGKSMKCPQLDAAREKYLKPVYINDDLFGKFALNKEYSQFRATAAYRGEDYALNIETDEPNGITAEKGLAVLRGLCKNGDKEKWITDAAAYAAKEMVDSANDWRDDETTPEAITEQSFKERISICLIEIYADGTSCYYFDDDDMFYSHTVVVYAESDGTFSGTNLMG